MMITKAVSIYSNTKSVKATARQLGVSHGKAMKLLVSAGISVNAYRIRQCRRRANEAAAKQAGGSI